MIVKVDRFGLIREYPPGRGLEHVVEGTKKAMGLSPLLGTISLWELQEPRDDLWDLGGEDRIKLCLAAVVKCQEGEVHCCPGSSYFYLTEKEWSQVKRYTRQLGAVKRHVRNTALDSEAPQDWNVDEFPRQVMLAMASYVKGRDSLYLFLNPAKLLDDYIAQLERSELDERLDDLNHLLQMVGAELFLDANKRRMSAEKEVAKWKGME